LTIPGAFIAISGSSSFSLRLIWVFRYSDLFGEGTGAWSAEEGLSIEPRSLWKSEGEEEKEATKAFNFSHSSRKAFLCKVNICFLRLKYSKVWAVVVEPVIPSRTPSTSREREKFKSREHFHGSLPSA